MEHVSRQEIISVLESVTPGLSKTDILDQSSCFVFKGGRVFTYNGEIACKRRSGLPRDFTAAVGAEPLLAVLNKFPDPNIKLKINQDRNELHVIGKGRQSGIKMDSVIALPIETVEIPNKTDWRNLPADFGEAIAIVQECAGKDESKWILTCVNITSQHIEACNNTQLTRYLIQTGVRKPFLVRRDSIKHVINLDMTKIAETNSWVHFSNPTGIYMSCVRHTQSYPDLTEYLDVEGTVTRLPKGLSDTAELCQIFSSENQEQDDVLQVTLEPGRLEVTGIGTSGWAREVKKIKYKGQKITFTLGPKMLVEIVKRNTQCQVNSNHLRVDGEKWVYVCCLGTINDQSAGTADVDQNEGEL